MFSDRVSRRVAVPALGVLVLVPALLLTSCGSPGHAPDAALSPGAHQSLAGTPGARGPGAAASRPPGMPGMTMRPPAGGGPAAPVAGNTVAIKNFAFAPATLTVKAGTKVTWTNQDTDAHTVTGQNGAPLRSPALDTGKSYSYTFTKPGSYAYLCTIHPFMTAKVTVTP
ncbi:cupredoxin family copper-binding protein [Streptomyces sp. NPDC057694]|uniref:cupredoxin domain-containing protein n=1 Tax=Streptomyces sp. NPDC057694 TaxID=3346216 RepID=UPI003678FB2C